MALLFRVLANDIMLLPPRRNLGAAKQVMVCETSV